jgi:hypothetical protein
MIDYLQVAMVSQALIFVTHSHGFFFMKRPSTALLGPFAIAQLVSLIIAAYTSQHCQRQPANGRLVLHRSSSTCDGYTF